MATLILSFGRRTVSQEFPTAIVGECLVVLGRQRPRGPLTDGHAVPLHVAASKENHHNDRIGALGTFPEELVWEPSAMAGNLFLDQKADVVRRTETWTAAMHQPGGTVTSGR
jgi:hypothetical protein